MLGVGGGRGDVDPSLVAGEPRGERVQRRRRHHPFQIIIRLIFHSKFDHLSYSKTYAKISYLLLSLALLIKSSSIII